MSKTVTPAGYIFTFHIKRHEYESDDTFSKEGVTEEQANLLADLANLITEKEIGLEYKCSPTEKENKVAYNILYPIFEKHKNLFTEKEFAGYKNNVNNMLSYITKNILDCSEYWNAALISYKVEYVPQEIQVFNVTNKFVLKK